MFFAPRGDKSRYVLPADFRKTVYASSGNERILGLTKHHKWDCLVGFGTSREDEFEEIIAKETKRQTDLGKDFEVEAFAHSLGGYEPVPFDPSGRWVMPIYLSEVSGIGEEMFLHGAIDTFTLWHPENLYAMESPAFDAAKAACRRMQADHRAAKAKGKAK